MNADGSTLTLIITLIALVAAVVIAVLGFRFLVGLSARRSGGQLIRLKTSTAIGSRARLLAVSYRGKEYLLGLSADNIAVIDSFPDTGPTGTATRNEEENGALGKESTTATDLPGSSKY